MYCGTYGPTITISVSAFTTSSSARGRSARERLDRFFDTRDFDLAVSRSIEAAERRAALEPRRREPSAALPRAGRSSRGARPVARSGLPARFSFYQGAF